MQRCPLAFDRCAVERPALIEREPGHAAACWITDTAQIEQRVETVAREGGPVAVR
jgi:hypothetical protein